MATSRPTQHEDKHDEDVVSRWIRKATLWLFLLVTGLTRVYDALPAAVRHLIFAYVARHLGVSPHPAEPGSAVLA